MSNPLPSAIFFNSPRTHSHLHAGFTLLEMAIALTVIGLLAGSFVVVCDMIRNAEVQSVIDDEDRYKKAIQLFKEKYNYLPGDMPTATNFWGTDAGCPNTGYSAAEAAPKTATCNGDGNGRIDTFAEAMRAWQQLANAGFIEGMYSGIQGNADANSIAVGTDVPTSKVPSCGWIMGFLPNARLVTDVGGWATITTNPGTYFQLTSGGLDQSYPGCLTPAESYSIDTKIDDGSPASGNVIEGGYIFFQGLESYPNTVWGNTALAASVHNTTYPCETAPFTQYNIIASGIYCDSFFYTGL